MTRRALTCAGLTALGLFCAFASSGYAAEAVYHGSLCNPVQEQGGQAFYNQFGIANLSNATPLSVACGGATQVLRGRTGEVSPATIHAVSVIVYDRHPTADVVCTLVLVDIFGVPIGSALSAFSSGSQANFQALTFNPDGAAHTISLQCSLPPATASGVSHLTTYRVISTP